MYLSGTDSLDLDDAVNSIIKYTPLFFSYFTAFVAKVFCKLDRYWYTRYSTCNACMKRCFGNMRNNGEQMDRPQIAYVEMEIQHVDLNLTAKLG